MKDNSSVPANFDLEWLLAAQAASEVKDTDEEEYNHIATVQSKPYVCQICNQGFIRNEDYHGHCLEHDGIEKPHTCPTCGKGFSRKGNLKSHMQTHSGKKPFSCEFCGKEFTRKEDLLGHRLTHDLFFCEACDAYHSRDDSQQTCVLQNVVEMYNCELCGKGFVRKSNLKAHELSHMGEKPYSCTICSKGFARKEDLNGHIFSHSGVSLYVCEICSKGFNRKSNFELHLRSHSKQIYSCDLCGKNFIRKGSFENHLRKHNSRPFHCELCKKAYSQKAALRAHCRTHHSGEVTEDGSINGKQQHISDSNALFLMPGIEDLSNDPRPVVITVPNSL